MEPEDTEENLITYREYINALKVLKNVYRKILPRTLAFKDVLMTSKGETNFVLSDANAYDFGKNWSEVNSIFKHHQFKDEDADSDVFMGSNPLSKTKQGK